MFYHVIIETNEKNKKGNNQEYYEFDRQDLNELIEDIIVPYYKKEEFQFDGYFINPSSIKRLVVKESQLNTSTMVDQAYNRLSGGIIMVITAASVVHQDKYTKDITKNVLASAKKLVQPQAKAKKEVKTEKDLSKVFIVHGHDDLAKLEVARFLEKIDIEPVILHEQVSSSKTIIEKIEAYSEVGFGVVIYTACDLGAKNEEGTKFKGRARQNVVFEHGFLIGKLGREKVCPLVKGDVETPNDISGIVYTSMDQGHWQFELAKELKHAGYSVDMNKL